MRAVSVLRLLGDEARLRLLRVLGQEALNVSELTAVLGLAQSGVSRHLGLLRKVGLVVEERSGGFTWYRLPPAEARALEHHGLWTWLERALTESTPATRADDVRLEEVRRLRKESFLEHGGSRDRKQLVPGRSWMAWSRALGLLLPPLDVVDLGCGDGSLTIEAARWARHVTGVDRSAAVLERARAMAAQHKVSNVSWTEGELESIPLPDASYDVVLLSQALHHAQDPARALREARRILRPGGRVLLLDLREHDEQWVRAALGDQWLGFSEPRLKAMLESAGFAHVTIRIGARKQRADPFAVLLATGIRN